MDGDPENAITSSEGEVFKKPLLPPTSIPVTKSPKERTDLSLNGAKDSAQPASEVTTSGKSDLSSAGDSCDLAEKVSASRCSGYAAPSWCAPPPVPYRLETLRLGAILETRPLESCTVFGRQSDCDVVLQHPSVSRYHAALLYTSRCDDPALPAGFYLCDLGSTHGTRLNKQAVTPRHYCRVRVGHMFCLGSSSRLFILQGPSDDEEPQSELSVTEIRLKAEQRRRCRQQRRGRASEQQEHSADEHAEDALGPLEQDAERDGIDWGMGEDADETTDLSYNPYALGESDSSQLYLDDPKRTLRGWFEREGYELTYQADTVTNGKHVCRVELPVEGRGGERLVAEVQHVGRKKDAVLQCALQACRLLDTAGLLRQSTHESHSRRKRRFSGSSDDDDTFLDRTGAVEERRRRKQATSGGGDEKHQPATHQALTVQYQTLKQETAQLQAKLDTFNSKSSSNDSDQGGESDALDAFMNTLNSSSGTVAKQEIRKIKSRLATLNGESVRLRRLVELTRPASLPPLAPAPSPLSDAAAAADTGARKPAVMVGKRKGGMGGRRLLVTAPVKPTALPVLDTEAASGRLAEHVDSAPDCRENKVKSAPAHSEGHGQFSALASAGGPSSPQGAPSTVTAVESSPTPAVCLKDGSGRRVSQSPVSSGRETPPPRAARSRDQDHRAELLTDDGGRGLHCDWLPPAGQTGDGRTFLNDKLGY